MLSRTIIAAAMLLPLAAHAQGLEQQVDTAVASITRAASGMSNQIAMDQQRIAQLMQQVQAVTAERDKLKTDATKPADPAKP